MNNELPMSQAVTLRELVYKGWAAWSIGSGPLELILVPQVGGRIMGLRWRGDELFFTQPERQGIVPNYDPEVDVIGQKRALGFPLWGGDKTWIAPQSHWNSASPYLDLDSGPYKLEIVAASSDYVTLRMTSNVCRETCLRVSRTVTVRAASTGFLVVHELENTGLAPRQAEIWDVAMVTTPGAVYLPTWGASSYPAGVKTYESEGRSAEVRAAVVEHRDGYAVVSCQDRVAFKFGVDGPEGWITAVLQRPDGRLVGYRKSMPVFLDRPYSHGCVAEVYQSADYGYLEVELHGPTVMLRPGDRFAIEERQTIADVAAWPSTLASVQAVARPED
jgi:hypothetical protein